MSEFLHHTDPKFTANATEFTNWVDEKFADDPRYQRRSIQGKDERLFLSDIDSYQIFGIQSFEGSDSIIHAVREAPGTKTDLCFNATMKEGRPSFWVAGSETTVEEVDGKKLLSDKGEFMSVSTSYSSDPSSDGTIAVATGTRQVTVERDPTKSFVTDSVNTGRKKTFYPERPEEVVFDTMRQIITKHHKPQISK